MSEATSTDASVLDLLASMTSDSLDVVIDVVTVQMESELDPD